MANERLRAEIDAREQAQSALLQAQKMEAMGQLTGGVAHDFNNLLTAVSGSLAMLEPRISDERSLRLLHTAPRGASQGAKLTESLLAFCPPAASQPDPGRPQLHHPRDDRDAEPLHRPYRRDPARSGERTLAGSDRYRADRDGSPQCRPQRARRHAGWWHGADRDCKHARDER